MLRINAIKIEINTDKGLFEAFLEFKNGMNIIRGDNSTGKSSMFQAILYGLGLEELLGRKNESTMQYVLREHVNYNNQEYKVLQSFVYLEFSNGKSTVTSKRSVICQNRQPQFVEVIEGAYLTLKNEYNIKPMWVHDAGGATNAEYGYHLFLQEFLGWQLPEVMTSRGDNSKLYIQQIAPSFILEQKVGWSRFLATMPYYNLKNAEARSIEFLLDLDVSENEKSKHSINIQKQLLTERWHHIFERAKYISQKGSATIMGLEPNPFIINNIDDISLFIEGENDTRESILDFVENLKSELSAINNISIPSVLESNEKNITKLDQLTDDYNNISLQYDIKSPELALDRSRLNNYAEQLNTIVENLRKNKDLLKLNKLGADINVKTALLECPLCKNDISNSSLLPEDLQESPMLLEDNISYLEGQKKMIQVYIEGQKKCIQDKETFLNELNLKANDLRQQIKLIRRELISDERLPSEVEIERKLSLRNKINFYNNLIDEFDIIKEEISVLSTEWKHLISREQNLPVDFYSNKDRAKLKELESQFISLLKLFNYTSQNNNRIRISKNKYLPVVENIITDDKSKQYDIRYDSSGSDFVRAIWAYTCALKKVSDKFNTNHPQLLILDEPQQQSASIADFHQLLLELSKYTNTQTLIFASFNNSEEDYINSVKNLSFHLNKIEGKIVKPVAELS